MSFVDYKPEEAKKQLKKVLGEKKGMEDYI